MDRLSLGIVVGCAVMFGIALVWRQYRVRLKADEEAREKAQAAVNKAAAEAKKKLKKNVQQKEKK